MRLIDATQLILSATNDKFVTMEEIIHAPTVNAEFVVHGTWIDRLDCDWTCSVCEHVNQVATPYCAWCGAQMDGWRHRDDAETVVRNL